MRVGDLLEWLACAAFVVGAYLATSLAWPPVLVGGVALAYQAQCYAGQEMPIVPLPRLKRKVGS